PSGLVAVRPCEDFLDIAATTTGCCTSCRRPPATAPRRQHRPLRLFAPQPGADFPSPPAKPRRATAPCSPTIGEVVAMRPEQPQCQCLARAQLQHQQANDTLLLMAIGTVVVIGGLVWLVGQVAGLLASGSWPDVPLAEVPRVLARLRERPGDPATAWPANVRDLLPGPLGMFGTPA